MLFLLKGLILGFSIAAPVGPIGVLCIRRTLSCGVRNGFISGLGAATADAILRFYRRAWSIGCFQLSNQSAILPAPSRRCISALFRLYNI